MRKRYSKEEEGKRDTYILYSKERETKRDAERKKRGREIQQRRRTKKYSKENEDRYSKEEER